MLCFGEDRVLIRAEDAAKALLAEARSPPLDDGLQLGGLYSRREEEFHERMLELSHSEAARALGIPSSGGSEKRKPLPKGIPRLSQPPHALTLWRELIQRELPAVLAFRWHGRVELQICVLRVEVIEDGFVSREHRAPHLSFALTGYRVHSNGTLRGDVQGRRPSLFNTCSVRQLDGRWQPWGIGGARDADDAAAGAAYSRRYFELDSTRGLSRVTSEMFREEA